MENYMVIWEAAVPLFFLFYGIKLKLDPPKMGEKGLGTRRAMKSKEAWALAHSFGSKLCLIEGVILLAAFIVRLVLFGIGYSLIFSLVLLALEFICLVTLIPLIDWKLKKTYGDKH